MYVDDSTGTARNITLPSTKDAYLIDNLKAGQRYRIKLFAIVDGNQVEVLLVILLNMCNLTN